MAPAASTDTSSGPVYVMPEPLFVQTDFFSADCADAKNFAEVWSTSKRQPQISATAKPYCPGEMLAKSALNPATVLCESSGVFQSQPSFGSSASTADAGDDREANSDCSTADTEKLDPSLLADSMLSMMGTASSEGWPAYPSPYWMPPYPAHMPAVQGPPFSQLASAGSSGHHMGRCKPCAFLYKEGCQSGAACQYCHLCPPGEKQRRKRVMRAMQRNMGPQPQY